MQVLLWLLIPLAGLIVAAAWVMWRSRPKRTPDAAEGMAEMYRIRQAMTQPMPARDKSRPEVRTQTTDGTEVDVDSPKASDATFRKSA